jgi:hypothetical protein
MRKLILPLALCSLLFALFPISDVKADDWNKKTVVTFDQDVEIPGWVLPAGTYVFKLLNSSSSRFIVQVWDQDEMHLITTLMTIGDSYPNPSGDSYFVLDTSQTNEGFPPAVVSWFFAGSDEGRDFIYPGYSTTRMIDNQDSSQSQPEQ